MRYLNKGALGALAVIGLLATGMAAAQQRPAGVPSVAPPGGDAAPPADLPGGGPSATSGAAATLRFDEVGYAAIGDAMGGVTVAAPALHPGSYAEITALDSGHIILAAVAPGSPPAGRLALLSAGAAHALGVVDRGTVAVRIREVQPQAGDEAALKRGQPASPRLGAPASLLTGLRARLAAIATPPPAIATEHAAQPGTPPATHHEPSKAKQASAKPTPPATPHAKPAPAPAAAGHYHVQVGAFANEGNARRLAAKLGGHVTLSDKLWLVELGPFADAQAAQRARDGAAKRGYGDARVRQD